MLFSPFLRKKNLTPPAEDVVQRGWLWKRGALNKGFKRRWFVLTCGGELFYYKSDNRSRYQNFIPLIHSVVRWDETSLQFEITMAERAYIMSASSVPEAALWVNWLQHFTTINTRENLAIEQAEAFLENNEYAQCALEEQSRRLLQQQVHALVARPRIGPKKAMSVDCLRTAQATTLRNPRSLSASAVADQQPRSAPETTPPVYRRNSDDDDDDEDCTGTSSGSTAKAHAHSHPCRNALLVPLALAAAGHHREKIKRMRSTSN